MNLISKTTKQFAPFTYIYQFENKITKPEHQSFSEDNLLLCQVQKFLFLMALNNKF